MFSFKQCTKLHAYSNDYQHLMVSWNLSAYITNYNGNKTMFCGGHCIVFYEYDHLKVLIQWYYLYESHISKNKQ